MRKQMNPNYVMWMPHESKLTESDEPIITHDNYDIFYYDGPLLWVGRNVSGRRVLGRFTDWKSRFARIDTYAIIQDGLCATEKNMRLVLSECEALYAIISFWEEEGEHFPDKTYRICFNDIPEAFLPSPDCALEPIETWEPDPPST